VIETKGSRRKGGGKHATHGTMRGGQKNQKVQLGKRNLCIHAKRPFERFLITGKAPQESAKAKNSRRNRKARGVGGLSQKFEDPSPRKAISKGPRKDAGATWKKEGRVPSYLR